MRNLIILLGCIMICSATPSWAQTNSGLPIDTRILDYYKQAGQGSIAGHMKYDAYTGYAVVAQNVRMFFIPGMEYTKEYIKNYRKSLKDYAYAVYRNNTDEGTELHLHELDPRVFSIVKSSMTDQKGSFQIHNLQPGWYYLLAEWRASYTRLKTTYRKEYIPLIDSIDFDCVGSYEEQIEWYGTSLNCDKNKDHERDDTFIRQVQTPVLGYYLVTVISPDPIIVKNDQTTIADANAVMFVQSCVTKFCDEFKHSQWFDDAARATSIPMIKR